MIVGQWFVNEYNEFKETITRKVDAAIAGWAAQQIKDAAEIEKLKGEIKAMKARAGKNKE